MAMQLRSGRRLASPVPVPGGDLRRVRPRRSQDGGDDDGKKDLISNLPEDMRLEVLARLPSTREAMRASILSEPWRGLWKELRELSFDDVTDLDSLHDALAKVKHNLNRLYIKIPRHNMVVPGEEISKLLAAAHDLNPLELIVSLSREHGSAPFKLPCFARATSIHLFMSRLRFRLPSAGSFGSLEQLTLFGGNSFIDPAVVLPRCPRLRSLVMDGTNYCPRGARALVVESSSLQELIWHLLDIKQRQPVDVNVVAPNLELFDFACLSRKFAMALSAPKLEELDFDCHLEDSRVGCTENQQWRLYEFKVEIGRTRAERMERSGGRHGGRQHVLSLRIDNVVVMTPVERSFAQEVARLPGIFTNNFSALELYLRTEGHCFGALVLQLLRIKTTIQRLKVILLGEETECWWSCDCHDASNWRNELISLPRLEVAEFERFHGQVHERDFLKLLFGSAPSLKTMAVHHFNEAPMVRAACQKLHSVFPANASVKFSFY